MGKRIKVQRRGRGSPTFRAAAHRRVAPAVYPTLSPQQPKSLRGVVEELVHDPGRGTPLARIRLESGEQFYNVASEGMFVGQQVEVGSGAAAAVGNVLPLGDVPEGTMVYNVELQPNDGGKIARASGAYATVVSHTPQGTELKLPSGRTVYVDGRARATVGVAAAGGRADKPFIKAGEKYHLMRAKGHKYPRVRGVAMIAALHPFGGGRHKHPGKPTTTSQHAPPGRKVGLIAARQSGRAKKSRAVATARAW